MPSELLNYAGLATALSDKMAMSGLARDTLLADYRHEIGALMVALHRAQVVGQMVRPADPAERCDLCHHAVKTSGLYVDGKMDEKGLWANMCWPCFLERGAGIGWGIGQLYCHDGLGWLCVAGGNSQPAEDSDM